MMGTMGFWNKWRSICQKKKKKIYILTEGNNYGLYNDPCKASLCLDICNENYHICTKPMFFFSKSIHFILCKVVFKTIKTMVLTLPRESVHQFIFSESCEIESLKSFAWVHVSCLHQTPPDLLNAHLHNGTKWHRCHLCFST